MHLASKDIEKEYNYGDDEWPRNDEFELRAEEHNLEPTLNVPFPVYLKNHADNQCRNSKPFEHVYLIIDSHVIPAQVI